MALSVLEKFLDRLKSMDILDRKPNLKLCSNHFKDTAPKIHRQWLTQYMGTAISDNKGWYRRGRR